MAGLEWSGLDPFAWEGYAGLASVAPPAGEPSARASYDAFGRLTAAFSHGVQTDKYVYHALETEHYDGGALAERREPVRIRFDGLGRKKEVIETERHGGSRDRITTAFMYGPTGELIATKKSHSNGSETYVRTMARDSLGRVVENNEPSSGTWRYLYDSAGRLAGSADARGCGKDVSYDAMGRIVSEDYRPCDGTHAPYSEPKANGDGTEVFYVYDEPERGQADGMGVEYWSRWIGRLAAVHDRASHTQFAYDLRGRVTSVRRQIAYPGVPAEQLSKRYATQWFEKHSTWDESDRLVRETTGADEPRLLQRMNGEAMLSSAVSYRYGQTGAMVGVDSSYGSLIDNVRRDLYGAATDVYSATTNRIIARSEFDANHRLSKYTLTPSTLSAGQPSVLESYRVGYNVTDDPISISDDRVPTEWPIGAKPVSRTMQVDEAHRVTRVSYDHGGDLYRNPLEQEIAAKIAPNWRNTAAAKRTTMQSIEYDWLGHPSRGTDSANRFSERAIGEMRFDDKHRLIRAENAPHSLALTYDGAGNTQEVTTWKKAPPLLPQQFSFTFVWDEVGQLSATHRFPDPISGLLQRDVTIEYSYAYDGSRVRTTRLGEEGAHSIDVFSTLRLERAAFNSSTRQYDRDGTEEVNLAGIARVVHNDQFPGSQKTRVFFLFGNSLGSTTTVVDRGTGELVEHITYGAYGDTESDVRPEKWAKYREKYRFSGKQDVLEAGLVYFGARYYSPMLMRWMSPDPMAIHAGVGDPYAYVGGKTFRTIDIFGLQEPSDSKVQTNLSRAQRDATTWVQTAAGQAAGYSYDPISGTITGTAAETTVGGPGPQPPPPPETAPEWIERWTNSFGTIAQSASTLVDFARIYLECTGTVRSGSSRDNRFVAAALGTFEVVVGAEKLLTAVALGGGGATLETSGVGVAVGVTAQAAAVVVAAQGVAALVAGIAHLNEAAGGGGGGRNEPSVLQTGGRTISQRTADALNKASGNKLHPREWGRALENLKGELGLRRDHHGQILSNGNYTDGSGRALGNITDYLP